MFFALSKIFSQSDTLVRKKDKKLIGYWKGAEFDKRTLIPKLYWTSSRLEDGTYLITFTSVKDCDVKYWNEKGSWWTNNDKIYKLNSRTHVLTVHNYKSTGVGEMFFSVKTSDVKVEKDDEFYFENLIID
ncbi:hypothetical protein AR687_07845 [Flavobacteriaceae bacterium CRH]|nr:hypothetical protein AR687_07845 [Flavobacteriaceae bacterium CRH]